jgi:hypothetical protein
MAQGLNTDKLIEEAVQAIPNELQEDLRGWLKHAGNGELSKLSQEMQERTQKLWRAFDNAAKKVEEKLQQ